MVPSPREAVPVSRSNGSRRTWRRRAYIAYLIPLEDVAEFVLQGDEHRSDQGLLPPNDEAQAHPGW